MHDGIIRWNQYALIAYLSEQLKEVSPQFGKTVLQKIVYILQEVYKIPCGYRYSLYSYGPYCSELPKDLDVVEYLCGVEVCKVATGFGGVEIIPGDNCDQVKSKGTVFIEKNKKAIEEAVEKFGHFSARDLELRSTILYCCSDINKSKQQISLEELTTIVSAIKPKFTIFEIQNAIESLIEQEACSLISNNT